MPQLQKVILKHLSMRGDAFRIVHWQAGQFCPKRWSVPDFHITKVKSVWFVGGHSFNTLACPFISCKFVQPANSELLHLPFAVIQGGPSALGKI